MKLPFLAGITTKNSYIFDTMMLETLATIKKGQARSASVLILGSLMEFGTTDKCLPRVHIDSVCLPKLATRSHMRGVQPERKGERGESNTPTWSSLSFCVSVSVLACATK